MVFELWFLNLNLNFCFREEPSPELKKLFCFLFFFATFAVNQVINRPDTLFFVMPVREDVEQRTSCHRVGLHPNFVVYTWFLWRLSKFMSTKSQICDGLCQFALLMFGLFCAVQVRGQKMNQKSKSERPFLAASATV